MNRSEILRIAANKRWALVNRNSGKVRVAKSTRDLAREAKRPTERIFDLQTQTYVR